MKAVKVPKNDVTEFEKLIEDSDNEYFHLKLYISGSTPQSNAAIENIKTICDENLQGRCTLEIIDLYQNPDMAREANVIAAPTLIKQLPLPLRRIIGDMSNKERVLVGLNLEVFKQS